MLVLVGFHFVGPPGVSIVGVVHFEHFVVMLDFWDILGVRLFDFLQSYENDLTVQEQLVDEG